MREKAGLIHVMTKVYSRGSTTPVSAGHGRLSFILSKDISFIIVMAPVDVMYI